MLEPIETVEEYCRHKDCVYRQSLDGVIDFCNYCVMEEEPRGCKISECIRYRKNRKCVTMTTRGLWWEIDDVYVD